MSDDVDRFVDAYEGGDMLNCVYFRLSLPRDSPFVEKYLRSMTLSKNRFSLAAFVVPVARLLASWQFRQITSAPHCSAAERKKRETIIHKFNHAELDFYHDITILYNLSDKKEHFSILKNLNQCS